MGHILYNILLEFGIRQHVNKPTKSDNILDLVFLTNDSLVSNVNTGPKFGTSDRKIVSYNVNLEVYKENMSKELIYIYCKGEFCQIQIRA